MHAQLRSVHRRRTHVQFPDDLLSDLGSQLLLRMSGRGLVLHGLLERVLTMGGGMLQARLSAPLCLLHQTLCCAVLLR